MSQSQGTQDKEKKDRRGVLCCIFCKRIGLSLDHFSCVIADERVPECLLRLDPDPTWSPTSY